jgi:hypothetical protein
MAFSVLTIASSRLHVGDGGYTLRVVFAWKVRGDDVDVVINLLETNGFSVKKCGNGDMNESALCDYWCVNYCGLEEVTFPSSGVSPYKNVGGCTIDIECKGVKSVEDDEKIADDDSEKTTTVEGGESLTE